MKSLSIRGVLFVALSLLPAFLFSQVVCTDINPDITAVGNATTDIDLNNDLTPDFRITSAQSGILSFVVVQGSQIGTSNFILTNGSGGASALPLNATIGSTSTTWTQMSSTNQQMVIIAGSSVSGPWAGATDLYLGMALAVGSNTYFGWARFSFSSTTNQYTLKDYAYQSNAGVHILAGESCASITNPQFTLPDSICAGSTVTVAAQTGTQAPSSYSWAASPGATLAASSASATALTFTAVGNSTVILYVANSSTFGLAVHTIQVKPAPTISLTPPTSTLCAGATVTLVAVGNAAAFSWTTNPPSTFSSSTSQSIVVTPTTTTNYIVEGTLNGCKKSAGSLLIIAPSLPIILSSTWSLCATNYNNSKDSVLISSVGHTISGTSAWPFSVTTLTPGGSALLSTMPPFYTSNTLIPVTLTVTGSDGCSALLSVSFSLTANPTVLIASSPSTLCSAHEASIVVSGAPNYTWLRNLSEGGFTAFSQGVAVISPTAGATYSVFGQNGLQCKSQMQIVHVNVIPGPTVTATSETTCLGNSLTLTAQGALNYSWAGPLGPVSTSQTAIVNAGNSPGSIVYTITGTDANLCTGISQCTLTILECTGMADQYMNISINLFPQPASDKLFVELKMIGAPVYSVIDAEGRKIKNGQLSLNEDPWQLDVSDLSSGIYLLKINNESSAVTKRFVKTTTNEP
jgi:hypothetical protein